MDEEFLNGNEGEVVQPESSGNTQEVAAPDISNMSDEEFLEYLQKAKDESFGEVQAQTHQAEADREEDNRENESEGEDEQEEQKEAKSEEAEPYKTFATREEYQQNIDDIVKKRLKGSREGKEQLESILQYAGEFYGSEDPSEIVKQLVDDLRSQNADKHGISVDEYNRHVQDAIDAKRYREQQRAQEEREHKVQQIRDRWNSEAEELKRLVPSFSFEKAIENKKFCDLITDGHSVSMAYLACNSTAAENNSADTHKRRSIAQNGNTRGGGSGTVEFNPETASDADFQKYIDKIRNRN